MLKTTFFSEIRKVTENSEESKLRESAAFKLAYIH